MMLANDLRNYSALWNIVAAISLVASIAGYASIEGVFFCIVISTIHNVGSCIIKAIDDKE